MSYTGAKYTHMFTYDYIEKRAEIRKSRLGKTSYAVGIFRSTENSFDHETPRDGSNLYWKREFLVRFLGGNIKTEVLNAINSMNVNCESQNSIFLVRSINTEYT